MTTFMRLPVISAIVLSFSTCVYAQISTQDLNTQCSTDLVNTLLGGGISSISNVTYTGDNSAGGTFNGGTGIVGFESGVILSSGNIADVAGPNSNERTTTDFGLPGDPDLQTLVPPGVPTLDAAVLEFDFVPTSEVITFKYVFMSEEYHEYVNSDYNDALGFFVNGVNIALLPDGVTPVSVNTVNGTQNPGFFIDNDCSNEPELCPLNIEADGLTVVLTTVAQVNPGVENHIKLAISDTDDRLLDSWVLIKADSFQTDEVPPSCQMTYIGTNEYGEKFIEITASDNKSGLLKIDVIKDINAVVTGHLAGTDFLIGTNDPVIVTATKEVQSQGSVVLLEVTDFAGNVTSCDPVITVEIRENGKPVSNTFTDIPEVESNITVKNGDPGLKNLEIIVNGDKYKVTGLQDNDVITLDVSDSMVEGDNNTITLTAKGKPGGSAIVVISD